MISSEGRQPQHTGVQMVAFFSSSIIVLVHLGNGPLYFPLFWKLDFKTWRNIKGQTSISLVCNSVSESENIHSRSCWMLAVFGTSLSLEVWQPVPKMWDEDAYLMTMQIRVCFRHVSLKTNFSCGLVGSLCDIVFGTQPLLAHRDLARDFCILGDFVWAGRERGPQDSTPCSAVANPGNTVA